LARLHTPICENQYFRVRAEGPHGIIDYPVRSYYTTARNKKTKKKEKSPSARWPPQLVVDIVVPTAAPL
jgi:hypothetical protein